MWFIPLWYSVQLKDGTIQKKFVEFKSKTIIIEFEDEIDYVSLNSDGLSFIRV